MDGLLLGLGRLAGLAGLVLSGVAIILRLTGRYHIGSFGAGVVLQAGMAAILVGCFFQLWVVASRRT
ncbi:MAG: hypothetical protein JNM61_09625 [Zoogloeaceae bacterium]|nr:hypothetical protein [Zoogloeaceae bacterium]